MDIKTTSTESDSVSALKYEKTQNRDVINTIERINRSQKFRPLAEQILGTIDDAITNFATKEFRQQWRNVHETHESPSDYNIDAFIGSPIYRKKEDGKFYYTLTLSTSFRMQCPPCEGESLEEAELRMSTWFSENISPKLNRIVVEHLKNSFDSKDYKDLFSFTLLKKVDSGEENKIGGKLPDFGKINISYMATLKGRKKDDNNGDSSPYVDSEAIHDGLISNVAMALERAFSANNN